MSYRDSAKPAVRSLRLIAHDLSTLRKTLKWGLGGWLVATAAGLAIVRMAKNAAPIPFVALVLGLGFFGVLFSAVAWSRRFTFVLELGDGHLRLRRPNGDRVADTRDGDLTFERVTCESRRSGLARSAALRMRSPDGEHLVTPVLDPDAPKGSGDPHVARRSDFSIGYDDYEALVERAAALTR